MCIYNIDFFFKTTPELLHIYLTCFRTCDLSDQGQEQEFHFWQ